MKTMKVKLGRCNYLVKYYEFNSLDSYYNSRLLYQTREIEINARTQRSRLDIANSVSSFVEELAPKKTWQEVDEICFKIADCLLTE